MSRSSLLSRLAQSTLLAALALALSVPALAADITVTSSTDDGSGGCTLREAVEAANTDTPVGGCAAGDDVSDTIFFDAGVTFVQLSSQITITEELIISGNGSTVTTVSGASANRVFEVQGATGLFIGNIEITSAGSNSITGYPTDGGALFISGAGNVTTDDVLFSAHQVSGNGGAVWVSATGVFTVQANTTFEGNRARGTASNQGGGAIYTDGGSVSVSTATFTDNRALGTSGSGGAILNPNGATLTVESSTFDANRSQRAGGAIETVGGFTNVSFSTFTGNTAGPNPGNGGAIHGGGGVFLSITGGSASGNRANEGGAFWIGASGALSMTNVSVTSNIAEGASAEQGGGGVYVDGGTLTINSGAPSLSSPRTTANASAGATNFFFDNRATGASGSGGAILVNGGTVVISGATFSENRARRAGGAIEVTAPLATDVVSVTITDVFFGSNVAGRAPGNGGGIHTTTGVVDLDVSDSSFFGNDAFSEGGAVWTNTGTTLTLSDSYLSGNIARGAAADNGGGGLFVNGGDATVTTTTFENNTSTERTAAGGGLLNAGGAVTVTQSLFTGNYAGYGGAIATLSEATVVLQNSTLYGNTARFGAGGYSASGFLDLNSVTVASNAATIGGGGLYNQNTQNQGSPFVSLFNTIVADNTAGNAATDPNLNGRHGSGGYNVIGTTPSTPTFPAQASDQTGTDPLLGPLQDNGGPTLTAALQSGSPAIDTGNTDLAVDQRGVARTEPDDVGAVEFGDAEPEADILISEFEPNPDGTDPTTVSFEISGTPGASFSGTILSIENDGINGTLDRRSDISGSFDANGLLVVTIDDLENPTFTVVLATDVPATTTVGTDLDANDDGTIDDLSALGTVLDAVGVSDATGDDGVLYASGLGGTDILFNGVNEPSLAFRDASTGAFYQVLGAQVFDASGTELDPADFDADPTVTTFGAINPSYTPPSTITVPSASLSTLALDALAVVPNPFGSRATATFAVTEAQAVSVVLYDVMGRQVQQVFQGAAQAETPVTVSVDGAGLASGVYVLVLQGETVRATRQVTVAR